MTAQGPRFGDREPAPHPPSPAPAYPVYELTLEAVRELDRRAVEDFGIPGLVLMENAARGLREHALEMLADARNDACVILCGPGNNGGDGFALARHLDSFGVPVTVVTLGDGSGVRGDAAVNLGAIRRMSVPVRTSADFLDEQGSGQGTPGLVVDALFGTGLTRPPEGDAAGLIRWAAGVRGRGARVLSIDVPSGLDAARGEPLGEVCVHADRTVTLAAVKPGLTRLEAQTFVGELAVADIGAPVSLLAELGTPCRGFRGNSEGESGA